MTEKKKAAKRRFAIRKIDNSTILAREMGKQGCEGGLFKKNMSGGVSMDEKVKNMKKLKISWCWRGGESLGTRLNIVKSGWK